MPARDAAEGGSPNSSSPDLLNGVTYVDAVSEPAHVPAKPVPSRVSGQATRVGF